MNNFNIAGNIATDLQPRVLPGEKGTSVVEALLAVDKPTAGSDAEFIPFVVYGPAADALAKFNAKGSPIAISGHIEMDRWKDGEDNNRSRLVLVAERVTYRDGRRA